MLCEACSQQTNQDARFCSHCGRPVYAAAYEPAAQRLVRPRFGRMIGGVCAGFAREYGWDLTLTRIFAVVLACCGVGTLAIAYVAAWILMPEEPLVWPAAPSAPVAAGSATIS